MSIIHLRSRSLRAVLWAIVGLAGLIVVAGAASYMAGEPIRNYLQRSINESLKGYTVSIGRAQFNPIGFSLHLYGLTIRQDAKPEPPIAIIPSLTASVHWSQIIRGRLVGDFSIDQPKLHLDLKNFQAEQKSATPVEDQGWQEAVQSIYPLKINLFTVRGADITYIDQGSYPPLRISKLDLTAGNIRNIRSPEEAYPSDIHLSGVVFGTGKVRLDGKANFLAKPHVTVKADIVLERVKLDYLKPIARRYHFQVRGGLLSGAGLVEYAIAKQVYKLKTLTLSGLKADYVHRAATAQKEKRAAQKTVRQVQKTVKDPEVTLVIQELKIRGSEFGFLNQATDPHYRAFFADADMDVKNLSNGFIAGDSSLQFTAKFMNSGPTKITAHFHPEKHGPDFEVKAGIEHTDMRAMSDIFRAYGDFSIESGQFSLFTELAVKDNQVKGYVKPLFKDMEVTDHRSPEDKNIFHALYVGIVNTLTELLENRQDKVATKTDISGRIDDPDTSTWQTVINLIRNAFFKAILPGFSKSIPDSEK